MSGQVVGDISPAARRHRGLVVLLLVGLGAVAGRLLVGRGVDADGLATTVFGFPGATLLEIRLSTVLAGAIAGAALGLSGLSFQILLRNPLASPWVLGVSSGAGFGLMLAMWLARLGGVAAVVGSGLLAGAGIPASALGALLAISIVWMLSRRLGGFDPVGLVLCGVVTSATFGAGIMLLQHLVPSGVRGDLVGWMMGRIPELAPTWLLTVGGVAVSAASVAAWRAAPLLDASSLGDDEARSIGVPLDAMRWWLLMAGGALAAIAVVLVGPIAFVGLLAPHAGRRLAGAGHRGVVLATAIAGATMLVLADAIRQVIDLGGGRLPVGVLTALVGGPAFLGLLLRGRGRS
jgi:iron complex transport system permease protein